MASVATATGIAATITLQVQVTIMLHKYYHVTFGMRNRGVGVCHLQYANPDLGRSSMNCSLGCRCANFNRPRLHFVPTFRPTPTLHIFNRYQKELTDGCLG